MSEEVIWYPPTESPPQDREYPDGVSVNVHALVDGASGHYVAYMSHGRWKFLSRKPPGDNPKVLAWTPTEPSGLPEGIWAKTSRDSTHSIVASVSPSKGLVLVGSPWLSPCDPLCYCLPVKPPPWGWLDVPAMTAADGIRYELARKAAQKGTWVIAPGSLAINGPQEVVRGGPAVTAEYNRPIADDKLSGGYSFPRHILEEILKEPSMKVQAKDVEIHDKIEVAGRWREVTSISRMRNAIGQISVKLSGDGFEQVTLPGDLFIDVQRDQYVLEAMNNDGDYRLFSIDSVLRWTDMSKLVSRAESIMEPGRPWRIKKGSEVVYQRNIGDAVVFTEKFVDGKWVDLPGPAGHNRWVESKHSARYCQGLPGVHWRVITKWPFKVIEEGKPPEYTLEYMKDGRWKEVSLYDTLDDALRSASQFAGNTHWHILDSSGKALREGQNDLLGYTWKMKELLEHVVSVNHVTPYCSIETLLKELPDAMP